MSQTPKEVPKPLTRQIDDNGIKRMTFDPVEMMKFIQNKSDDERLIIEDENGGIFWITYVGLIREALSKPVSEYLPA